MNQELCTHCNGYGSSWKDKGDERCSQCGGSGLRVGAKADSHKLTLSQRASISAKWRDGSKV